MKSVLGILSILAAINYVAGSCNSMRKFSTTLVPECAGNDVFIKWPNYKNESTYYRCDGIKNPVLTPCEENNYFIYVLQECGNCDDYIPPVPCENLKTQNPPDCVDMTLSTDTILTTDAASTAETSATSTTNTAEQTTIVPPTISPPSASSTIYSSTSLTDVPTPPVVIATTKAPTSSGTTVPPPPSPQATNADVPMPPTPEPTPPSYSVQPPIVTVAA